MAAEGAYTPDQLTAVNAFMGVFQAWGEGKFHKGHPEGDATYEKFTHPEGTVISTCAGFNVPGAKDMFRVHRGKKECREWWEFFNENFAHTNMTPHITAGPAGTGKVFMDMAYDTKNPITGKVATGLRDACVITMKDDKLFEFKMFFGASDKLNDLFKPVEAPTYLPDQNKVLGAMMKLFGVWASGAMETTSPDYDKTVAEHMSTDVVFDAHVFGDKLPEWKVYKGLAEVKIWSAYYEQFDQNKETMKVDFVPGASGSNKIYMVNECEMTHKKTNKKATGVQDVAIWTFNKDLKISHVKFMPGNFEKYVEISA